MLTTRMAFRLHMASMADLPPFWTLVERHGGELLSYAHRLVGRDAEDVVQEALLRALRSYPRLPHGDHLRAWLYRITTTTALDHHSRRAGKPEVLSALPPERPQEDGGDDDGFHALISTLSEGVQRAMELRFIHDLPYAAIGARLGCSEDAARQRVSSGLKKVRRRLS